MPGDPEFEEFFRTMEPRLRLAFVSFYGPDRGIEAASEALAYAWEHWERVRAMANPAGYLFRVGQSRTRRLFRRRPVIFESQQSEAPLHEPGLETAMRRLSPRQRAAVTLVHGYGYSRSEAAALLGTSASTIQNHVERGLARLRQDIGGEDD